MHKSTLEALEELEKIGELLRIKEEVDPNLEMAEIHRQVFDKKGPAILFEKVKGSPFMACSNIYGSEKRVKFLFGKTINPIKSIIAAKSSPIEIFKNPLKIPRILKTLLHSLPLPSLKKEVLWGETTLDKLPQIKCWPQDGGSFILLPQVFCENIEKPGWLNSNLGMYRIQLSGNDYKNNEIGLHYQIHRGMGVLHQKAIQKNKPFKVSIFVGGPPAHTFAAVMPLPEGMSELTFAGMLANRNFKYTSKEDYFISAQADFCIVGEVSPDGLKPEGPFGDHLGYYSLTHDFPFLKVHKVYHKKEAIWPFTVVQRPPAEDSYFGWLVHEITGNAIQHELPGVKAVHAVDVAGVHPLLLAVGTERYTPYKEILRPTEILTQANAILGFGQCSLAKYLIIGQEHENLDIHNLSNFLNNILERIDLKRDLHFITNTTIDTLDYSSEELNYGSKLIIAAAGKCVNKLANTVEIKNDHYINYINRYKIHKKGILLIESKNKEILDNHDIITSHRNSIKNELDAFENINGIKLIVEVDNIDDVKNEADFFWITFTRSDPARDIYGINETIINKHYACDVMIIDATIKKHHAPILKIDDDLKNKVSEFLKKKGI